MTEDWILAAAARLCDGLEPGKRIFAESHGAIIYGFLEKYGRYTLHIFGRVPNWVAAQGVDAIRDYVDKAIQGQCADQKARADRRSAFYQNPNIALEGKYGETLLKGHISRADGKILEVTLDQPGVGTAMESYENKSPLAPGMFAGQDSKGIPILSNNALECARDQLLEAAYRDWKHREMHKDTIALVEELNRDKE